MTGGGGVTRVDSARHYYHAIKDETDEWSIVSTDYVCRP